jgi:hypothetical protein
LLGQSFSDGPDFIKTEPLPRNRVMQRTPTGSIQACLVCDAPNLLVGHHIATPSMPRLSEEVDALPQDLAKGTPCHAAGRSGGHCLSNSYWN